MAGSRPVLRLLGRGSALIVWSSRESAEPRHFPRRVLLKTQCYVNFKVTKCPVEFVSGESKNGLLPFERHYSRLDNVGRATVKCSFCDYIHDLYPSRFTTTKTLYINVIHVSRYF